MVCYENKICKEKINGDGVIMILLPVFALRSTYGKMVCNEKRAPFQEIAEKFQIHPILARLIRNRDVIGDEAIQLYLNGTIADLYDGMLMKDMDKAVDILLEKYVRTKRFELSEIMILMESIRLTFYWKESSILEEKLISIYRTA